MLCYFVSFHSHFWERQINGSTPIKTTSTPGQDAPMHFYQSSFQWAKPMLYVEEFQASNSKVMKQFLRHGNVFKNAFQNVLIMG